MMLLLAATTDKLQLTTSSAASVDVISTYMDTSAADPPVVKGTTSGRQLAIITTAATTDIVAAPAATTLRGIKSIHIRNKSSSASTDVTVLYNANGTTYEVYKAALAPGEMLEYVEGVGFFEVEAASVPISGSTNLALSSSAAGFATDTYVANSQLDLDALGAPRIGRAYHWRLIISKTAAGLATPILTVRVGTAGSTADTARLTFTWGAGTAAADRGEIELDAAFQSVGSGTSAVLRGKANWTTNLTTTGLSNAVKALQVTSSGFDSTVANSIIGLSYNGGTSAVHTIEYVSAYTDDF
jgi:hypothetical protein